MDGREDDDITARQLQGCSSNPSFTCYLYHF